MKKLLVGFITYNDLTAKYLPYFLNSLKEQTSNDFDILAIDNSEDSENENSRYIEKKYKNIELEWSGENIGFARAHNVVIKKAIENGNKYVLLLNPDMLLEPDAIEKMLKAMDSDKELGSICPKIMSWIFDTQNHPTIEKKGKDKIKTKLIDTCGIISLGGLRFADLGQGALDKNQFDKEKIVGPSGCAAMYRVEALEKVAFDNNSKKEYFDELMFMYKEDVDLAYRLQLAGFKSKCVPEAIIYHDRTAKGKGEKNMQVILNRKNKSNKVKEWSFLNQHIIFVRYWKYLSAKERLKMLWYAFKMFIFVSFFERYLLKQYKKLWKIRKEIRNRKFL